MLQFRTVTCYDFTLWCYDSDFITIYDLMQSMKDIWPFSWMLPTSHMISSHSICALSPHTCNLNSKWPSLSDLATTPVYDTNWNNIVIPCLIYTVLSTSVKCWFQLCDLSNNWCQLSVSGVTKCGLSDSIKYGTYLWHLWFYGHLSRSAMTCSE